MSASPQKEKGYTAIANEIMEALSKMRIAGEARQVLDFILRKTYGFNKKKDAISLSQFYLGTGMTKTNIIRAIKHLQSLNIINVIKKDNGNSNIYWFNKDYTSWKPLPKKITVIKKDNKLLSKKLHTKVDNTKVDKGELQEVVDFYFSLKDYSDKNWIKQNYPRFVRPAKRLLKLGTTNEVKEQIEKGKKYFDKKELSWTLETIEKKWNELKQEKDKKKGDMSAL